LDPAAAIKDPSDVLKIDKDECRLPSISGSAFEPQFHATSVMTTFTSVEADGAAGSFRLEIDPLDDRVSVTPALRTNC
jgi:hypothetical protein